MAAVGSESPSAQFRERLGAEHFLISQRVSWLILSQSFLFIAYTALIVGKPSRAHEHQAERLLYAFPALGIVIVAGVYASILAALITIRELRERFESLQVDQGNPFDDIPTTQVQALGNVAAHVPPLAIGATWICLLAANVLL